MEQMTFVDAIEGKWIKNLTRLQQFADQAKSLE